jgi:hypothetical protein
MLSCQYVVSEKTECFDFDGYAWQNWMVRFAKSDRLILTDRTYVSLVLIIVILLSYASRNICSCTHSLHLSDV